MVPFIDFGISNHPITIIKLAIPPPFHVSNLQTYTLPSSSYAISSPYPNYTQEMGHMDHIEYGNNLSIRPFYSELYPTLSSYSSHTPSFWNGPPPPSHNLSNPCNPHI